MLRGRVQKYFYLHSGYPGLIIDEYENVRQSLHITNLRLFFHPCFGIFVRFLSILPNLSY